MGRFVRIALTLFGAIFLVYWAAFLVRNEWRLATRLQALGVAADTVVAADPGRIDPDLDGRTVHLTGRATGGTVRDPVLGAGGVGLRLDRTAETYQWIEDKQGAGHDRVVRYERQWRPERVPSERFDRRTEHHNPSPLPLTSATFAAPSVRLGPYAIEPEVIAPLPATAGLRPEALGAVTLAGRPLSANGTWLQTGDPEQPRIGDVRVGLALVPEGTVSVVARQEGDRLVAVPARDGSPVALAVQGEVSADRLVDGVAQSSWGAAWRDRLTGSLGVLMGTLFVGMTLGGNIARLRELSPPRRLLTVVMAAIGLAAIICAAGWIGVRLAGLA